MTPKTVGLETYMEIKGEYRAYNPTLKKCNLCFNQKLETKDNPDKNLLNKKSEGISQWHHRNRFMLVNHTSRKIPNAVV